MIFSQEVQHYPKWFDGESAVFLSEQLENKNQKFGITEL
jgi:hypothetical protein